MRKNTGKGDVRDLAPPFSIMLLRRTKDMTIDLAKRTGLTQSELIRFAVDFAYEQKAFLKRFGI